MLKKEVERLVLLGVLERSNVSEWGSPAFAQPKPETNQGYFIIDFINLNKQLKCKPYQMSNINKILLKLEGFQYATSLDLNMRYYHIWLSKNASNLCIIIIPWGEHCYRLLPIGITSSPETFQQEMNDLFHEFVIIRAYIEEILVLTMGYWRYHVQKLERSLSKMKQKWLKCNIKEN